MKKQIIKTILKGALLLVLLVGTGLLAGRICRAKFIGDSTTMINGFYEEKHNDLEVVLIGSSNCFCSIDPMVLYREYGITAYDFCSSSQPLNISVLYLKEAMRTQNPKVVALEVNMLTEQEGSEIDHSAFRWGYTDIPFSIDKLKCIYQSLGKVDRTYMSYVFPIEFYHNRWKELSKIDYTYMFEDKTNYTKGYLRTQSVVEEPVDFSQYVYPGQCEISEKQMKYLDEFNQICEDNGAELLLFKAPREGWHQYHTETVAAVAEKKGIEFIDYNTMIDEVGLDVSRDFRDELHLNDFGAEKVSRDFGGFLKEHYQLTDRRIDQETVGENSFDIAAKYQERAFFDKFHETQDLLSYLQLIQETDGITVVLSADGHCGTPDAESMQILAAYGISAADINQTGQWILQDGEVIFHTAGVHDYTKNLNIGKSDLVVVQTGSFTKIYLDGGEYHKTDNGLNFVIFDHLTRKVSDAVGFEGTNGLEPIRVTPEP